MASSAAPVSHLLQLRSVCSRIAKTPRRTLLREASYLATSIAECKSILASPVVGKEDSEAAVLVHRLRTQLSTLLQDKTIEGRLTATILVKCAIEQGGWEILSKSGPWVKALLTALAKPDPPSSRKIYILTLCRIFLLTQDYPTLIREITTPALVPYIKKCLAITAIKNASNGTMSANLMQPILESFSLLLQHHTSLFRSFSSQIHETLLQVLSRTNCGEEISVQCTSYSHETISIAQTLFIQLHRLSPRGASSEEWEKTLGNIVEVAHNVCDRVFRSVVEDWQSSRGYASSLAQSDLSGKLQQSEVDSLGLSGWVGLYAGSDRVVLLLGLIRASFSKASAGVVTSNLGIVLDLVTRILSLIVPSEVDNRSKAFVHYNDLVEKEEQVSLRNALPRIHVAALEIISTLIHRFGRASFSFAQVCLEQALWLFEFGERNSDVRKALYRVNSHLIDLVGPSLGTDDVEAIEIFIRGCCEDLLEQNNSQPAVQQPPNGTKGDKLKQISSNVDNYLNPVGNRHQKAETDNSRYSAAYDILPLLHSRISPDLMSQNLRTSMDRTAILTRHKAAMIASILNPPSQDSSSRPRNSLLPFLAQLFPSDPEVEALIRPRMPLFIESQNLRDPIGEEPFEVNLKDVSLEEGTGMDDSSIPRIQSPKDVSGSVLDKLDEVLAKESSNLQRQQGSPLFGALKRTPSPAALGSAPSPKRTRFEDHPSKPILDDPPGSFSRGGGEQLPFGLVEAASEEDVSQYDQQEYESPRQEAVDPAEPRMSSRPGDAEKEGEDSSDDDFGELVLGPDTEDEE